MKSLTSNQIAQVQGGILLEAAAIVIGGASIGFATGVGTASLVGIAATGATNINGAIVGIAFGLPSISLTTMIGTVLGIGAATATIAAHNYNGTHCW